MAGSIQYRGKDKDGRDTWLLTASEGFDAQRNRVRITRTFHGGKREAEKEKARLVAEAAGRSATSSTSMTIAAWAEIWDKEHIARNLAPKTAATYRMMLRHRIIPALGAILLQKLAPSHLKQFYANLDEDGVRKDGRGTRLSGATQAKCHRVLSAMLQEAVYRELIPHNPASDVRPPQERRPEIKFYDEEEIRRLLIALQDESSRFRAIVLLALATGMRRGEILALEWGEINWQAHLITVKQSAYTATGQGQQVKAPKTATSARLVAMPADLEDALRAWQQQQSDERVKSGSLWQAGDYIFTNWDGSWLHVDSVTREWEKFLKRVNKRAKEDAEKTGAEPEILPPLTFHGLRHTAATFLLASGIDVRAVSGILGHAQASTTLNIYGHMLQSSAQRGADAMQEVFHRVTS